MTLILFYWFYRITAPGNRCGVMINRRSWGCLYFVVRGEILGFTKDKLMRKRSSRILSLTKNERVRIEDD
jgi:hypothetical protein